MSTISQGLGDKGGYEEQDPGRRHDSIISPVADFMLVGGVTLLVFPFVMLPVWDDPAQARWLEALAYGLIFVLNLPHFIHSYQLLYKGFGAKLAGDAYGPAARARFLIAGIAAPLFLIGFLLGSVLSGSREMLGYATNLMLFTLGWHYVKQGYGIMIALSVRKKVFFDNFEKRLLLANAYIAWLYSWFVLNSYEETALFHGVPYSTVGFAEAWREPVTLIFLMWTIGTVLLLIRKFDKKPVLCVNGLSAYFFSVYPWVLFAFAHPNLIIFVPALHSLQYILCVWKLVYERTRGELAAGVGGSGRLAAKKVAFRMLPFVSVGFSAGALLFVALPLWLDGTVPYDRDLFGQSLFVYCFLIFLNVHHYFIDFAIWRRENPEMAYLFR